MKDQIKQLVDRFLAWQLPERVRPDNLDEKGFMRKGSSGTNLLTADEATQMFEHVLQNGEVPKQIYFVVEMLRNDDREQHSYVDGIYNDELTALKEAWSHIEMRAGKYGAEISGYHINGTGPRVYFRKLDSWEGFAASCRETAKKIREMLDAESKSEDEPK